jgi:hypothetical protein
MAVGMASGEVAVGHGWVREDAVRAALNAIERELALAMHPPRKLAGSRLLRLRLLLLAVESSDLALEDGCRVCVPRCGGRRRLPDLAPGAAAALG